MLEHMIRLSHEKSKDQLTDLITKILGVHECNILVTSWEIYHTYAST